MTEITPGPALDAAVAKACGLKLISRADAIRISNERDTSRPSWDSWYASEWYVYDEPGDVFFGFAPAPNYSTDLNAAFEAAEKCGLFAFKKYKDNLIIYRGHFANPDCWCIGTSQYLDDMKATGRTLPLAICSAILAIHGKADA